MQNSMYNDFLGAIVMFYKRNSDCPLGFTYTIGFWVKKKHTTAFFIVSLQILLYIDLSY